MAAYEYASKFRLESLLLTMAPVDLILACLFDEQSNPHTRSCTSDECSSKIPSWASYESQQRLSNLIQKHWFSDHGPSRRYLKSLIRRYVSRIETLQEEIDSSSIVEFSDELMEAVALACMPLDQSFKDRLKSSVLLSDVNPSEWGYVSFHVPRPTKQLLENKRTDENTEDSETSSTRLKIRVFPQHNDDGVLKVWEAGACLAEYLMDQPNIVSGKRVVELGAGVGFTGLVASGFCGAAHVQMTDYSDTTLENLRYNISINQHWLQELRGLSLGEEYSSDPHSKVLISSVSIYMSRDIDNCKDAQIFKSMNEWIGISLCCPDFQRTELS